MNRVAFLFKEVANLRMVEQLPALIKMCIFPVALWVILRKEVGEPLQRRTLGDACVAMLHARKMISNEDPASLAINPLAVDSTI